VSNSVRSNSQVILSFIGLLLALCLSLLLFSRSAHAVDWSWAGSKPVVFRSDPVADIDANGTCATGPLQTSIYGEAGSKRVCVSNGTNLRFGIYSTGYTHLPVIGFRFSSVMFHLNTSVCSRFDDCVYVPGSDMLITKQNLINGYVRSLVIYKNFSKRLTLNPASFPLATAYNFNSSHPDYIFQSQDGYAWPIGGMGVSENGEWLGVEFRQRGIGLLNLKTLTMKRISNLSMTYGLGSDPTTEIAIDNSGQHLAVMGINAGTAVFDTYASCGDLATDQIMWDAYPVSNRCYAAQIDDSGFIFRYKYGVSPRFNDEGTELRFYAISYLSEVREVVLRAYGYFSPRMDYLALGDSFSSGEGETSDANYLQGTNDKYEKCHISNRSYPYLVSAYLNIESQYGKSVACSGAVTDDVWGSDIDYWGQQSRLGENGLLLAQSSRVSAQTFAKENFLPGRVHQVDFANRYYPQIITVGIGGNNVGFMSKLKPCATGLDTCEWAATETGREKTANEIKGLFTKLVDTYQQLHDQSPWSKIYVIGYPKVITNTGTCNINVLALNTDERIFMNQAIAYINLVIEAAAKKAGVKYINIENSLGSQVLCGTGPSAVNALRFGDDVGIGAGPKVIGQEGFHPNPLGHALIARAIEQAVPDMLTYSHCGGDRIVCPQDVVAPDPPAYWIPAVKSVKLSAQHNVEFTNHADAESSKHKRAIVLQSFTFLAGSLVRAEVHSDPVVLGEFSAGQDGSLTTDITLPADLPEGYHTIHLYGTSYGGEEIDLYDVIYYGQPVIAPQSVPASTGGGVKHESESDNREHIKNSTGYTSTSAVHKDAHNLKKQAPDNQHKAAVSKSDENKFAIPGLSLLMMGIVYSAYIRLRRGK
jgi:lysophospholipase L1-like esterase